MAVSCIHGSVCCQHIEICVSLSDPVGSQVVPRELRVDAVRFRRGQCLSPGEQSEAEGVCACAERRVTWGLSECSAKGEVGLLGRCQPKSLSFLRVRWKEPNDIISFSSLSRQQPTCLPPGQTCLELLRGRGCLYVASCNSSPKGSSTGEGRKGTVPGVGSCAVVATAWLPHQSAVTQAWKALRKMLPSPPKNRTEGKLEKFSGSPEDHLVPAPLHSTGPLSQAVMSSVRVGVCAP